MKIEKIGIIGLGRMGRNLALNMIDNGFSIVAYNRTKEKTISFVEETNQEGAFTLDELKEKLPTPRVVWVMLPSGEPTETMIENLSNLFDEGDIIIDGGNSFYKDSIRRGDMLKKNGIRFLDVGTSGGIEGARNGACYMIGGDGSAFELLESLFEKTSVKDGYGYFGKTGNGHFVKMVHNGIEYAMMQSIGEGFEVLKNHDSDINFEDVARVWSNGSVIRGWLMELTRRMFSKDPSLKSIPSEIGQNGEGLWTLEEALRQNTSVPAIAASIFRRFDSQKRFDFSSKVIQGLRKEFGGHGTEVRLNETQTTTQKD